MDPMGLPRCWNYGDESLLPFEKFPSESDQTLPFGVTWGTWGGAARIRDSCLVLWVCHLAIADFEFFPLVFVTYIKLHSESKIIYSLYFSSSDIVIYSYHYLLHLQLYL